MTLNGVMVAIFYHSTEFCSFGANYVNYVKLVKDGPTLFATIKNPKNLAFGNI